MSAPVDYKSHELNLYSNNNVGRLKFEDGKGSGKGVGFGTNQEYIFAKYTDSANQNMQWPVCIPELFTVDNSSGYVLNIAWTITNEQKKLADETQERKNEDFALNAQLSTLNQNIISESKARQDGDAKSASDLSEETKARQQADNGNWATILIVEADSKARDSALDIKLGVESTRATDAESALDVKISNESNDRKSAIATLNSRVDFIASNSNMDAIDSLTEIISTFSNSGADYNSRIAYLESVVASLVNKNQ